MRIGRSPLAVIGSTLPRTPARSSVGSVLDGQIGGDVAQGVGVQEAVPLRASMWLDLRTGSVASPGGLARLTASHAHRK